jgi:cytidine deaminase
MTALSTRDAISKTQRTAFFKAVYEGQRHFSAIAVVGGPEGQPISDWCTPCGVCRQVMREFCDPDSFRIIVARSPEERRSLLLRDLLPEGFGPEDLGHHRADETGGDAA